MAVADYFFSHTIISHTIITGKTVICVEYLRLGRLHQW